VPDKTHFQRSEFDFLYTSISAGVLNFIDFNCHSGLVASISYIHAVFVGTYLHITYVLLLSAEFAADSRLLALNVSLLLLMVVRRQGQFV